MKATLIRSLLVLLFGVALFYPNYGIFFLGLANFSAYPFPVVIVGAVCVIIMTLILPLPVHIFRIVSSVALVGVYGMAFAEAYQRGWVDFHGAFFWLIWVVLPFFALLAWLLSTMSIWRTAQGIVPTQSTSHVVPESHH